VTWEARHFGITWRLTSKIVEYDPPARFVDEMQRGPFRRWRREHLFRRAPDGTTLEDLVE
jgi:ligand-binding SRPBCC domain-containing protein